MWVWNSHILHEVTKPAKITMWNWCIVWCVQDKSGGVHHSGTMKSVEMRMIWHKIFSQLKWCTWIPWGNQNIALNRTFNMCCNSLIAMQCTCSHMYQNINPCPKLDNLWLLYPDSSPSRGRECSWHSLWMFTNCGILRISNTSVMNIGHVSKLVCTTCTEDQFLLKQVR